MKKLNMESAIKRYNLIMNSLCYEHNTIGEWLSENTENWNLRDMIAECDYVLSTFYECGHCNNEMESKEKYAYIGKLKRFINTYEPFTEDMECSTGHCSIYD